MSGGEGTSAVDRLAEAAGALAGRPPLAELDERVRAVMADLADLAAELRSVVETWEDDPGASRRSGPGASCSTSSSASTATRWPTSWPSPTRPGPGWPPPWAEEERAAPSTPRSQAARADLAGEAAAVADARRAAAPLLAWRIEATLHDLAMPSARFEIAVEGEGAGDQVTFLLGANPGEPLLPWPRSASGGELARTMLAVRLALTDAPGVLVFDEVDAGVGGEAAIAVGAALAGLAEHAQVLVVTHLAQVAAQADHQIEVRKAERRVGPAPRSPCSTARAGWSSSAACCRAGPTARPPAATPGSC